MLFFDRRRRMSRVFGQNEFKSSASGSRLNSPFNSQAMTSTESDCGRNSPLQEPNSKTTCNRCSSYACCWFPSLSLADWVMLQLIMGALLLSVLSGIVSVQLVFSIKKHLDVDIALLTQLTQDVYKQAIDCFRR